MESLPETENDIGNKHETKLSSGSWHGSTRRFCQVLVLPEVANDVSSPVNHLPPPVRRLPVGIDVCRAGVVVAALAVLVHEVVTFVLAAFLELFPAFLGTRAIPEAEAGVAGSGCLSFSC